MKKIYSVFCLVWVFYVAAGAQCDGRYQSKVFTNVTTTADIVYGSNVNSDGNTQDLHVDFYEPTGDTATMRPLLIFAHGGSFYAGDRTSGEIVYLCEEFAKRGYACASIQYRLESSALSLTSAEKMVKAVMRAVQDGKAAIRFFRKDAATTNTYKIDPDQIYIGGTSAGGVLGVQLAYMDDYNTLSSDWQTWMTQLGGMEGNSGNAGYPSNVKAVYSFAGAIGDSSWMLRGDQPLFSIHSHGDQTVPDSIGYPINPGFTFLPKLYGGQIMNDRLDRLGIYNEYYQYAGSNHPPFYVSGGVDPVIMDSTERRLQRFLYKTLECNPDHYVGIKNVPSVEFALYPNPAKGVVNIDFDQATYMVEVFDIQGSMVNVVRVNNQLFTDGLNKGMYFIRLTDKNGNSATKSIVIN